MNIFHLDNDPIKCAQYHCDKHVVKMVLETAQILSTVSANWKYPVNGAYKPTHQNHPCVLWAGYSFKNFQWLANLGVELSNEYFHRYNKEHKSSKLIDTFYQSYYIGAFENIGMTAFPQCMPDEYCDYDPVKAYRNYYLAEKSHILTYTNRELPDWFPPGIGIMK